MTLSVLWRSGGCLHIASDSRISFHGSGDTDIGVKVMRLPLRVLGTSVDKAGNTEVLFEQIYGFSYAGSLANASTFKALIEDLLLDIQYIGDVGTLSFLGLCEFLKYYCGKISTEVCSHLFENGKYCFFFTGYCPAEKRLRAALFTFAQIDGKSNAQFNEIATNDGDYFAIGKGADEFNSSMMRQEITWQAVLLTLNKIIDDRKVPSVGGDIQYGTFNKNRNFSVSGIVRISSETTGDSQGLGPTELRLFKYRGFQLYENWNHMVDKFWPSPVFRELEVPSNAESHDYFVKRHQQLN